MAKEKAATQTLPSTSHSAVETIIGALSQLENDIDGISARVEEMKKRIMVHSNEEIENLKQQIVAMANEEAKKIVDNAKVEAEKESAQITAEAEDSLKRIKKNIDSSFDRAVVTIVKTVLGEAPPVSSKAEAKSESPKPAKIKKFTADGKAAS